MLDKSKMHLADSVLSLIEEKLKNLKEEFYLGAYQNGRENGYHIKKIIPFKTKAVCFSENRNSDQIVVYSGVHMENQGLSDEMYKNAKYFRTVEEAANFIYKFLISE